MGAERRVFPRAALHVRVTLTTKETVSVDTRSKDVSIGGLCVMSPQALPDGIEVIAKFELLIRGKYQKLSIPALVVHSVLTSDGFRIGLQFAQLDDSNSQAIQAFVRSAGARPPGM
ncbi:MAG: PilZ domain-containing protein [Pseudomonadota bacterium]